MKYGMQIESKKKCSRKTNSEFVKKNLYSRIHERKYFPNGGSLGNQDQKAKRIESNEKKQRLLSAMRVRLVVLCLVCVLNVSGSDVKLEKLLMRMEGCRWTWW
jgi:hypothetical protein